MKTQVAVIWLSLTIMGTSAVTMECLKCDHDVPGVGFCNSTSVCQETEVCSAKIFVVGNRVVHRFGCMERNFCIEYIKNDIDQTGLGKKRAVSGNVGVEICSACCGGDLCNRADCFVLRKNMTIASLGSNPVVVG